MEWMHEYLPEELRDDDEIDRRVRTLLETRSRTVSAITVNQGEGSSSTTDVVSAGRRKRKESVGSVHSAKGSKSKKAARIEADDEDTGDDDIELEEKSIQSAGVR
ncbi:hypothetical protein BGZ65_011530, partial [Modicella reniformis]